MWADALLLDDLALMMMMRMMRAVMTGLDGAMSFSISMALLFHLQEMCDWRPRGPMPVVAVLRVRRAGRKGTPLSTKRADATVELIMISIPAARTSHVIPSPSHQHGLQERLSTGTLRETVRRRQLVILSMMSWPIMETTDERRSAGGSLGRQVLRAQLHSDIRRRPRASRLAARCATSRGRPLVPHGSGTAKLRRCT